jgi:hypothetical protein
MTLRIDSVEDINKVGLEEKLLSGRHTRAGLSAETRFRVQGSEHGIQVVVDVINLGADPLPGVFIGHVDVTLEKVPSAGIGTARVQAKDTHWRAGRIGLALANAGAYRHPTSVQHKDTSAIRPHVEDLLTLRISETKRPSMR